jgi:polyhydroxyalkanoate synthesis repressor PhaR
MAQRGIPGEGSVVIRKYVNRRLYDTTASRYVTLDEVAARVAAGQSVRVEDARSRADITSQVLTQAIFEGESGDGRLLSREALEAILHMQNSPSRKTLSQRVTAALTAIAGTGSSTIPVGTDPKTPPPMRFRPIAARAHTARLNARIDALQVRLGRLITQTGRDKT